MCVCKGVDFVFLQARQDALEARRRYIVLHKCVSDRDLWRLGEDVGEGGGEGGELGLERLAVQQNLSPDMLWEVCVYVCVRMCTCICIYTCHCCA
jgi:hypothetical protein